MTTQTTLTDRQRKQAEAHARKLITTWTNDTLKTGRAWTPDRISRIANAEARYVHIADNKRRAYAAILAERLADNFDVDMTEYHAEMERLRQQFSDRMDELDAVYQRDTRPCLEGKPSVKVVMTKDGPQALLPTFDPPPVQKGEHIDQLTMF
jgi:hypothetical protein